jgi:D-alanine-D-alanine ligase
MRVLIVHEEVCHGARTDEADVLVQADVIRKSLSELGHEALSLGVHLDLESAAQKIQKAKPDLVFNIVESLAGYGRLIHLIPSLLDALKIPYTGASAEAQLATSNKLFAKHLMFEFESPTAIWYTAADLAECEDFEPGRYIIKSVWEHASVGLDEDSVVEVDSAEQLLAELNQRLSRLGGEGFAEQFIDGREFNLALLGYGGGGVGVLPPAEILFDQYSPGKPRVVGYRAKWDDQSFEFHHTPRQYDFAEDDRPLIEHLSELALACWDQFQLTGYARVDFRVDHHGWPSILEINTNPCLSPDAGFAAALKRAGIPFNDAIRRIIDNAVTRHSLNSST